MVVSEDFDTDTQNELMNETSRYPTVDTRDAIQSASQDKLEVAALTSAVAADEYVPIPH